MESTFESLRLQDCIFIIAVTSTFIVLAAFASRRTWVSAELFWSSMFAIAFIGFPQHTLGFQMSYEPSSTQLLLARLFGVVYFGTSFSWFRTRETRDATVQITLMTSRVVSGSILLMSQIVSYMAGPPMKLTKPGTKETTSVPEWSEQTFVVYFVFPTALWVIGNLIQLLRCHDFHFYPQHNIRLNNHLRVDAWFMLLFGVALMAYPSLIFNTEFSSKVSTVSIHILRSVGAISIGEAVTSLQAPGFLHPRDKQALFGTRLIMSLLQFAVLSAGCFWYKLINFNTFSYTVGVHVPLLVNAIVGLVTDGTTIYSVPTPKKRLVKEPASSKSE